MKKRILAVLLALGTTLLYTVPVLATDPPDATPTITNIHVNRKLIVDTDVLIYGDYYIRYDAPLPTEPAGDTYAIRIIENGTEIGGVTPYSNAHFDRGYNHGVFGIYFDTEITWGHTYTIRLSESPAYFASPLSWDFAISPSAYTALTDKASNQSELTTNILSAAGRMEDYFTNTTMIEAAASGTVLSSPVGENYFRGAISGIQFMAPALFYIQAATTVELTPHPWTTVQFDEYAARFNGTWVGNDTAAIAVELGTEAPSLMALLLGLPLSLGAVIFSSIWLKKIEPGFIVMSLVIIVLGIMGWFPMALLATYLQLCAIYLAYVFFFSRG